MSLRYADDLDGTARHRLDEALEPIAPAGHDRKRSAKRLLA